MNKNEPRNWSIRRRSKSSRSAPDFFCDEAAPDAAPSRAHPGYSFAKYAVASISTRHSGEPRPLTMHESRCGGSRAKFAK